MFINTMSTQRKLPILPRATAIWLVDNTALTFKQIAEFCGIHELEIKGIADGEVSQGIMGLDPVAGGQLTNEEILRCTNDPTSSLRIVVNPAYELLNTKKKQQSRYTPVARRQDKPDAIYWLIKNCPEIPNNQIIKLVGTTKATIQAIRDRSHWNMKNIRPRDPVLLGICSQIELDSVFEQVTLLPKDEHSTKK